MELKDEITAVRPAEYPRILEIWETAVRATHHFLAESDLLFFKPIVSDMLQHLKLAAMRDTNEQVVAYVGVSGDMLEMLFVHPDYFSLGIGKKLLAYAIETWGVIRLDVNEQNTLALNFYLNAGFEIAGRSELDGFGKPYPLLHLKRK